MTSMPASRSARAITLAPRSWPSSPGLAITTLIFELIFLIAWGPTLFIAAGPHPRRCCSAHTRLATAQGCHAVTPRAVVSGGPNRTPPSPSNQPRATSDQPLDDRNFFVLAPHVAQRVAHFPHRRVGA